MHGCRPIIGLDGCHLKIPFGGILLTAVVTDPNDGIYPLAWAQVEGLVNAFKSMFPQSEHRFYSMHLSKNLANEYRAKDSEKIQKMEKRTGTWCPNAMKPLKKYILKASNEVQYGGTKYLVTMSVNGHEIVFDLEEKTRACRKWQLSEISCFHACACIFFKPENLENYLHDCYRRSNFLNVYSHFIEPVNGEQYWEETTQIARPLPPIKRTRPERPKKKRDTKNDEVKTRKRDPTILKRVGTSLRCS
ncbi:uncharacterized protein LOC141691355 [Apium graveolens]|uniref:uncharacterized protein LOC141691355 n=1 Tax=Apium graveolens TaxID=4045 RepID=UPI003D798C79